MDTRDQRPWLWVPATGSPRRKRRGVPLAGTTRVGAIMPTAFVALFTFQTTHLVPAARFCARGLQPCFTHPQPRGGRSAEKRSGACEAPVGRAMTRDARLSAL